MSKGQKSRSLQAMTEKRANTTSYKPMKEFTQFCADVFGFLVLPA